jgi:hypothetical protein
MSSTPSRFEKAVTGDARARAEETSLVMTPKVFWIIFGLAWLAYLGLYSWAAVLQGYELATVAVEAPLAVLSMAVPAVFIAWNRRTFLRPRVSTLRYVGHKIAAGVVYGLVALGLASVCLALGLVEPGTEFGNSPSAIATAWFTNALFLYVIFLVFLVWSDALDRLQETRSVAAREAVLRAEAESKALRAQFNPHFVFNTLHSLMLLVRKEPETAERAIEDVAALIRYASTLQRREIDQVPLSTEISFARRYLALEKLRLAERLTVAWNVEEHLENVMVPAFSLQTLLENSIKHGISVRPEGGRVSVSAIAENGRLDLTVEDDGAGADPETVRRNGGSGLELLERRLTSVYAGEASLEWRTSPGAGFEAIVHVPLLQDAGPRGSLP